MRYEADDGAPLEEVRRPCRIVLTGRANGTQLVVRCECFAEVEGHLGRYYNYDPIGFADTIEEAKRLWADHEPHVWLRRRYRKKIKQGALKGEQA